MVHCLRSLLFLSVISWSSLTVIHAVRFGENVVPDLNLQRNLRQESHDAKRVKAILLPSERPELKVGEIIEFELFDDNIVKAKVTAYVYHGIDSSSWLGDIVNSVDETKPEGSFSLSCEEKACVAGIVVYSPVAEYNIGPLFNSVVSNEGDGVYQLMELDLTKKKVSGSNINLMSYQNNTPAILNLDEPRPVFRSTSHKRKLLDLNRVRGRSHIGTEDLPLNVDIPTLIVDCLFYYTPSALARVGRLVVQFI